MSGKLLSHSMKKLATRPEAMIAGFVLLVGLLFAVYTQHVWEDYWITFRASKNLATGQGLVFTPGERLHTFTSPLGVLLPAAFYWMTGSQSDIFALWLFRMTSLAALATGLILLFRSLRSLQLRRVSCWLTVALIGLDAKTVDFSINGMETGLLIFFLALAVHGLLVSGPRQVLRIGIGWAGLMWTRPDSCVYIAVLGVGSLLFSINKTAGISLSAWLKTLLRSALVCTILYLPWFLWAWSYYGSPIPHTIIAKGVNHPPINLLDLLTDLLMFPLTILTSTDSSISFAFLPGYVDHGGWPDALVGLSYVLGLVAALAWLIPVLRPQTRLFSLAYLLGNFFLTVVLKFFPPWYLPIVAVFGYLTLGLMFDQMLRRSPESTPFGLARNCFFLLPKLLRVSAIGLVAGQLAVTICVGRQLQVQQALIENGLRRPIGLWLRDHARTPQDTVMLEPLGYIGYYSGLKMLDYPGLASKEMVEARKRLGPGRQNLVYRELKPDWVVLRQWEAQTGIYVDTYGLQYYYELVQVFDATDKINAINWLPGRPYLQYDQTFLIFHRKAGVNFDSSP
jgi:hypothetical protein